MASAQLVGPFPPGVDPATYDRLRRRVLWKLPSGLYLLGSRAGHRRNLMTCNWVTQVALDPKLVGVSVETGALTHELIGEGGGFTISLLAREDRALVRKFVKPAADDPVAGTLNGVGYLDAPVTGSPVVMAALGWIDCRLTSSVACGSHSLFVGEVVDAAFGSGRSEDDEVLRVEDTRMSYGG